MSKRIVFGVMVRNRTRNAPGFQQVITQYGCSIKTRIGLHEVTDGSCSPNGLILLEMYGEEKPILELEDKLRGLEGFEVQKMVFEE